MAAVVFGATLGPRPRGTEAEFGSGCLRACRRIGMSQRCKAQLDDLFGALTDLTLNTQNTHRVMGDAATHWNGSDVALLPESQGLGWGGQR